MFGALAEAIEGVEAPVGADELAGLIGLRDRLDAAIAVAVSEFDRSGGWELEGHTSMTAWLRHRGRMVNRDAARLATTARRLRSLPVTSSLYGSGELSGGQVAAVMANVSDTTEPILAVQEPEVVPWLAPLSVSGVARVMGGWRRRAEALLPDGEAPVEPERSLHLSQTLGGRYVLDGDLDAEGGAVVDAAMAVASTDDAEGERRSPARRRADALVDVCRWFLDHQHDRTGGRHRPHLNVVVDLDALEIPGGGAMLADGLSLDAATTRRLLCDAGVHRVITAGRSAVLDYGRATRTIAPSLWAALVLRDRHCRHPGCDRGPKWCDGHHLVPWEQGGPTELANLALGCSRHHHLWHSPGWHAKLLPNGDLHVTTPDGTVLVSPLPP